MFLEYHSSTTRMIKRTLNKTSDDLVNIFLPSSGFQIQLRFIFKGREVSPTSSVTFKNSEES